MEGLSSEVGNKMRSAVKAKLIELGSGTAGYIDDELPDYVMIMVANKRSKEQMIGDLSLFLGKNTDTFVSWLHQVLEKLEEVTLPSNVQKSSGKRKTSELTSSTDKRDKKTKPKKRGTKDKTPDKSPVRSTTPPLQNPATTSITDVFADHLIQKAKKVIEPPLSVKKAERNGGSTGDGFDIPTISEIAKKAVGAVVCRKEITELAELQKKIDQAKRQLRHMTDESEDEDFLNLGADKLDFDAELGNNSKESATSNKLKSNDTIAPKPHEAKIHQKITFDEKQPDKDSSSEKGSVLNRLGTRGEAEMEKSEKTERNKNIISLSAHRRMEQAIYVPAHRRTAEQSGISKRSDTDKVRDRSPLRNSDSKRGLERGDNRLSRDTRRSRDANEPRDLRERVRQRERDIKQRESRTKRDTSREVNRNEEKTLINNRIGSRVIVAPSKPEYVEDEIEVPVSSVVKVKPRPLIPKSKQASKNLLLRAVAEAQKSTALATKPATREFKATERNTKELYTKSFRNKLQKGNIVVEIAGDDEMETIEVDENENAGEVEDEEYVPVKTDSIDEDAFVYIPQAIHSDGSKDSNGPKTQFVVTLDSLGFPAKKKILQSESPCMNPDSKIDERKKTPISSRIGRRSAETENEMELRKAVENSSNISSKATKRKRTPIKFDINDREAETDSEPVKKCRSRSVERKSREEHRKSAEKDDNRRRDNRSKSRERDRDNNELTSKMRTLKTNNQNKYDNLPPLSSAITVTSSDTKIAKKDRCKFYPSCTRGERCDYYHPTTPCKAFPNCKYGDVCLYIHPKCKFDLTCSRLDCNFTHTPVISAAPPLASHVVPVTNYKKIVTNPLPTLCRFYPNCSNTLCEFYHPKPCKFGKSCTNKVECNFYHFDLPIPINHTSMPSKNKLKWVASTV